MTTEPSIVLPANFTDEDIANWMREKSRYMDHLNTLHAERRRLVDELTKLDAEIAEFKIKSAIQIQSK